MIPTHSGMVQDQIIQVTYFYICFVVEDQCIQMIDFYCCFSNAMTT